MRTTWHRVGQIFAVVLFVGASLAAAQQTPVPPKVLLKGSLALAEKTHYLEALDLLNEARDMLEGSGDTQGRDYGDVLYALAQTKIKGRIHQDFPAFYVKGALKDVQAANNLRDKLSNIPPQQLAEGYFLEGYIHKKFFLRNDQACTCFKKALTFDPGFSAAKRELSELPCGNGAK